MAETVWKELKATVLQRVVVAILLMPWILPRKVICAENAYQSAKGRRNLYRLSKGIAHFPPEIKMDDNAAHERKVRPLLQLPMAHIFILSNLPHRRTGHCESWYRSHRR